MSIDSKPFKDRFIPYQTLYEVSNDQNIGSPLEFYLENIYTHGINMPPDPDAKAALLAPLIVEYQYYRNATPYFKVPSKMIPAMFQTCLNRIPVHNLKLPFSSFAILLPEANPTGIEQLLVCLYSEKAFLNQYEVISPSQLWNFCIIHKKDARISTVNIGRQHAGNSVLDCIRLSQRTDHVQSEYKNRLEHQVWQIAISTILLTTGSHKYLDNGVMDHLLNEFETLNQHRRQYNHHNGTDGGSSPRSNNQDSHRKLVNGMGESQDHGLSSNVWQRSRHHTSKKPHHRGGHWRSQACGKQHREHKIIFIHPMRIHG